MSKLSFETAKRLSIIKWEYIVNNNGSNDLLLKVHPELASLRASCGFCELQKENYPIFCDDCYCFSLCNTDSIYFRWSTAVQNNEPVPIVLPLAKQILEIIKNTNEK